MDASLIVAMVLAVVAIAGLYLGGLGITDYADGKAVVYVPLGPATVLVLAFLASCVALFAAFRRL